MKVMELVRSSERNQYGELMISPQKAINSVYPELIVQANAPGPHGLNPRFYTHEKDGKWRRTLPEGRYESRKHFHTAGTGILEVESGYKKHNFSPLFLLRGRHYNGDFRSMAFRYALFGRNEDGSFFVHHVRPKYGEQGLDASRQWMWSLQGNEKLAARQGDLGFIAKTRMPYKNYLEDKEVEIPLKLGNHRLCGDRIVRTKSKNPRIFVMNPIAVHYEHNSIQLEGCYEVRLAREWILGLGD